MSKTNADEQPPAYDGPNNQQLAQPSQAHLDPRAQQNFASPAPSQQANYNGGVLYHPNQGGYNSPAPQSGYASPGPQGFYGEQQQPYGDQRGMFYGPQGPEWQQHSAPPPQAYYQQGGYYPQQPSYGYPPQHGYYDNRGSSAATGCCAIFFGSLAACCCLDLLLF